MTTPEKTPLRTPDLNKMQGAGLLAAFIGLLGQFLSLPQAAQNNLTTICLAVSGFALANDVATKGIRGRIAHLFQDADKSGTADIFENVHLAWKIAIFAASLSVGLLAALIVVLVV
jgi:hypothetical protein